MMKSYATSSAQLFNNNPFAVSLAFSYNLADHKGIHNNNSFRPHPIVFTKCKNCIHLIITNTCCQSIQLKKNNFDVDFPNKTCITRNIKNRLYDVEDVETTDVANELPASEAQVGPKTIKVDKRK